MGQTKVDNDSQENCSTGLECPKNLEYSQKSFKKNPRNNARIKIFNSKIIQFRETGRLFCLTCSNLSQYKDQYVVQVKLHFFLTLSTPYYAFNFLHHFHSSSFPPPPPPPPAPPLFPFFFQLKRQKGNKMKQKHFA